MVVESTGQQVELEGGEGVTNKLNMASDTKYEFQGKQMTTCEITSALNSANGNGVEIDCDDVTGKKYAYEDGGVVFINYKKDEIMYEPMDGKYYANDMEFDTLEEAQKFLDSGGVNENLRGAYERGLFKAGGGVKNDGFELELQAIENTDFPQNRRTFRKIDKYRVHVNSIEEAKQIVSKFIQDNDLGGGSFIGGQLYKNNKPVAYISYNLRVWEGKIGNMNAEPYQMEKGGGVGDVYIALSKTNNALLLSERFDKQITHQQLVDYYKKRGYEIIDSNIFKVTNKDVLDVYKDAISKFIEEKYNELVDWENTFLSYEIVGDRIIAQSCFVQTQNGKEYKITPNDLVNKKFAEGGGVKDFNSLIGKYVNIYSMGVSSPTEHQIKDVMVSGENFRYRYVTLKFDLGIAPIPLEEADALLNNEIIFVNDNKEEFGVQLIPNQFKEGGGVSSPREGEGLWVVLINYEDMSGKASTRYYRKQFNIEANSREDAYKKSLDLFNAVKANKNRKIESIVGSLIKPKTSKKMSKGGDVRDFEWYQMWKKDQVKKGTAHEMEHLDTIREFKKRGVSDKEVAEAIAKDHLDEDENYYIELEKMDVDAIKRKKKKYEHGGNVHNISKVMHPTDSKVKRVLKNDFDIDFKPKNIYYPKQSLGLKRIQMPQIRGEFLPLLFDKLDKDRIGYEDSRVMPNTLKPSQDEINIDNANRLDMDSVYLKKAIVSNDNFIIDGHHRWYYCLINDIPIDITKIDLPIEEALNYIRQLDFVEVDTIEKGGRMLSDSQNTLFEVGGNIEASKYSKEIPLSIYKGIISDYDKDGISNADDLQPYKSSETKL